MRLSVILLLCFLFMCLFVTHDSVMASSEPMPASSRSKLRVRRARNPQSPPISPEDHEAREFWGGSCLATDWQRCKHKRRLRGRYWVRNVPRSQAIQYHSNRTIECALLKPYWCLKNGWTVTDCQLLCMATCNRVVLKDLFDYVSHTGECPLIS